MASVASNAGTPSAQVIGNAFVEQYYHILHTSPELVYRFYQDSSVLSRPDASGKMSSVTTMQGINEKILSLNFKDCKAEIKTADAQKSHMEGVTVLVTGSLTDKDNLRKKFAQSFFLAPQDNGYFVLNDVFRFVDDNKPVDNQAVNGGDIAQIVPSIPDPEPSHVSDPSAPEPSTFVEAPKVVDEKAIDAAESDKQIPSKNEMVAKSLPSSNGNEVSAATEPVPSAAEEDAPKKSYASIVKVAKGSSVATKVYVPANTSRMAAKKSESHPSVPVSPAPEPHVPAPAQAPSSNDVPGNDDTREEAEGYSIYVRNLPYAVTADQLEEEFKKFGPIKQEGIQVRFNKQQRYCFGFVEFLSMSSLNDALQASPVTIGGRQAVVEMKRTSSRVGSERDQFPSGRGGFRTDNLRGRGNYSGGRGFIRNDAGGREANSGRGRGPGGRGEGYHHPGGRGEGNQPPGSRDEGYQRPGGRGEGYHHPGGRGEGYQPPGSRDEGYQRPGGRGEGYQHRSGRGEGYQQRGRGVRPNGPKSNAHPS